MEGKRNKGEQGNKAGLWSLWHPEGMRQTPIKRMVQPIGANWLEMIREQGKTGIGKTKHNDYVH